MLISFIILIASELSTYSQAYQKLPTRRARDSNQILPSRYRSTRATRVSKDANSTWFTNFHIGDSKMLDKIEYDIFHQENEPYFTETIPVKNNTPLEIHVTAHLIELVAYNTLNEELEVLLEVLLKWEDHRLHWDPKNYGNIEMIDLPSDMVWFPNIGVFNAIDGAARFTSEDNTNKVEVFSDGRVFWEQMSGKRIKCPMKMKNFPFDVQVCFIDIWTLTDHHRVSLKLDNSVDRFARSES